jgi:hypothetical protein
MKNKYRSLRNSRASQTAPSEILAGFVAGLLLAILPSIMLIDALRRGAWPNLQASLGAAEPAVMLLFWVMGGAITAVLFTLGFAVTARLVVRARLRSRQYSLGAMPVTGDEDEQD